MASTYDAVRQAIAKKQAVIGWYDGYEREMCPHVIGSKNGRPHALFYQFGGGSRSGLGPDGARSNWRCIDLDKLSVAAVRDGDWHTAPNHTRPQTCVDQVDLEIAY